MRGAVSAARQDFSVSKRTSIPRVRRRQTPGSAAGIAGEKHMTSFAFQICGFLVVWAGTIAGMIAVG